MKKVIFVLLFLLSLHAVEAAKEGNIRLLAISEYGGKMNGSVADLHLEIRKGEGRVFIDTIPLAKTDTQMSTRFAKNLACDYLNLDCESYDFIYTIKSKSIIIGGPSAGSAITALTIAVLKDIELDGSAAITGTINSGGLIGTVGGIKEKIEAAANEGIKTVMIPKGSSILEVGENVTLDLIEYGKNNSVEVREVSDLYEVMAVFTGTEYKPFKGEIVVDKRYKEIMKGLSELLCNRTEELRDKVMEHDTSAIELVDEAFVEDIKRAKNLTMKSEAAFENESYYTAASYCFGANTKYGNLIIILENITDEEFLEQIKTAGRSLLFINKKISNKTLKTMTDLQAYMIVKERIVEAMEHVKKSKDKFDNNETGYREDLAYSIERMFSAISWSEFFDQEGRKFELNDELLKKSCIKKISEAQERVSFVELILGEAMEDANKGLEYAQEDFENSNYELCLFKASKAKAEANTILGVAGVTEKSVDAYIDNRIDVVKRVIVKAADKGIFPILGYSYFEYAQNLRHDSKYSTLLYLEYALELSDMDRYFEEKIKPVPDLSENNYIFILILGILIGLIISTIKPGKKK